MSFPYFKPNGKLLFNTDGTLTAHENCCCTLYCGDCCTGTFSTSEGYEITISGVTTDEFCDDCGDLNDTFCVTRDDFYDGPYGCDGLGTKICGYQIYWFIKPETGGKCTLVVSITDGGGAVYTGHSAVGELEFDAGDPCRDVSGAMTMTITPPFEYEGVPMPADCDLDGTQITVNGVCSE